MYVYIYIYIYNGILLLTSVSAAQAQAFLVHCRQIKNLERFCLSQPLPMVNMGHTSMLVPLNFISKARQYTGHHANQLTNQLMDFVCRADSRSMRGYARNPTPQTQAWGGRWSRVLYPELQLPARGAFAPKRQRHHLTQGVPRLWYWTSMRWCLELSGDNKGHGHPGRLLSASWFETIAPYIYTYIHLYIYTYLHIYIYSYFHIYIYRQYTHLHKHIHLHLHIWSTTYI